MNSKKADPVVVVGYDAAVLHSLQLVLRLGGFSVIVHRDQPGLHSLIEWPRKGCLLIEHNMPMMPGLELLTALRARAVTLPAILFTNTVTPELEQRAADAGALRIFAEPLAHGTLAVALRDALKSSSS